MSDSFEEFVQDIGNGLIDFILYVPRRVYGHFKYIKDLEQENKKLEQQITDRDNMFKRIVLETERTSYGNEQARVRKIKELAQTFPPEQS